MGRLWGDYGTVTASPQPLADTYSVSEFWHGILTLRNCLAVSKLELSVTSRSIISVAMGGSTAPAVRERLAEVKLRLIVGVWGACG